MTYNGSKSSTFKTKIIFVLQEVENESLGDEPIPLIILHFVILHFLIGWVHQIAVGKNRIV